MSVSRPRVLIVAGHDSSGGAGVDADREAAERFDVDATCVVTAWTRQEGGRVHAVDARAPDEWLAEAHAGLAPSRAGPAALKAGLLPGADHVRAFARLIDEARRADEALPVVVDPVLAATGGAGFLDEEGVAALLAEIVPRGVVLTPNVPEAARLVGRTPDELAQSLSARVAAAVALLERGARAVVLKGGHGDEDPVRDLVLERGGEPRWGGHARVPGGSLHGSGCRYATALAAGLARGVALGAAAERAGRWVAGAIERASRPGAGGPA